MLETRANWTLEEMDKASLFHPNTSIVQHREKGPTIVGRGSGVYTQDVQRCAAVPGSGRPAYWDVAYYFRGIEHRVQMSAPPGATGSRRARSSRWGWTSPSPTRGWHD